MNTQIMSKNSKIYVAGHDGMVGSAIIRTLKGLGYTNIVTRGMHELDLTCQEAVDAFFSDEKPEFVVLAAAKVGGIAANSTYPADFMYVNMMIEMNVVHAAWKYQSSKLLFLGSSCIYPRLAPQPMPESCLLTSELEQTNEAYALAKIAGLKYCSYLNRQYGTDFISIMPTNLYGPNDNYHPLNSHVLPALIRRFHEAKEIGSDRVTVWGTGTPKREFLFVDDLAEACVFLLSNFGQRELNNEAVNIGTGKEVSIRELAETVKRVVGFAGELEFDTTKPDGTPRKLVDVSKLKKLGWSYSTELEDGIKVAYQDFLKGNVRTER